MPAHRGIDIVAINEFSNSQLVDWNRKLTDVIIADIFTPPVACRIYAYTNVAAYETVQFLDPNYKSLSGQLNEFKSGPQPEPDLNYYLPLLEIIAFTTVAKELVWNIDRIDNMEEVYLTEIREIGIDRNIYTRSVEFYEASNNLFIGISQIWNYSLPLTDRDIFHSTVVKDRTLLNFRRFGFCLEFTRFNSGSLGVSAKQPGHPAQKYNTNLPRTDQR